MYVDEYVGERMYKAVKSCEESCDEERQRSTKSSKAIKAVDDAAIRCWSLH
jgi:hypothetical protein